MASPTKLRACPSHGTVPLRARTQLHRGYFAQWPMSGQTTEDTAQAVLKQFVALLGTDETAPAKTAKVATKRLRKS